LGGEGADGSDVSVVSDTAGSTTNLGVILGIFGGIAIAIGSKAKRYIDKQIAADKGLFELDQVLDKKVHPDLRIVNRRVSQAGGRKASLDQDEDQIWIARGEQTPMIEETFTKQWRNQLKLINNQPTEMLEKGLKRMQ
jgi:hypothetical protein